MDDITATTGIAGFKNKIRHLLGKELVDIIDQYDNNGRIGIATKEDDRGEDFAGTYNDAIKEAAQAAGMHATVMPFPVRGKLVYEVVIRKGNEND